MRLIDADALLDKQESLYMRGHVLFHGVTAFAIENAPTILPTSAKWEKLSTSPLDGAYACSACGSVQDIDTGLETPLDRGMHYCPNCGAKIDDDRMRDNRK